MSMRNSKDHMTVRELEDAIYEATHDPKVRKIITAYRKQESRRSAERVDKSRATKQAKLLLQQQASNPSPAPARDNLNLEKTNIEKKEGAIGLPRDWEPNEYHAKIVADEGRLPGFLHFSLDLFRGWLLGNPEWHLPEDWNPRFTSWLRITFLKHPDEYLPGGKPKPEKRTYTRRAPPRPKEGAAGGQGGSGPAPGQEGSLVPPYGRGNHPARKGMEDPALDKLDRLYAMCEQEPRTRQELLDTRIFSPTMIDIAVQEGLELRAPLPSDATPFKVPNPQTTKQVNIEEKKARIEQGRNTSEAEVRATVEQAQAATEAAVEAQAPRADQIIAALSNVVTGDLNEDDETVDDVLARMERDWKAQHAAEREMTDVV